MATDLVSVLSQGAKPSKSFNITFWVLKIVSAVIFLLSGGSKLAGTAFMVAMFDKIGIGQWFRYFTGGLEVVSALLLLMPKTSAIGASLLAATMVGAIFTHLFIVGGSPVIPIVLLLVTSAIALKR